MPGPCLLVLLLLGARALTVPGEKGLNLTLPHVNPQYLACIEDGSILLCQQQRGASKGLGCKKHLKRGGVPPGQVN